MRPVVQLGSGRYIEARGIRFVEWLKTCGWTSLSADMEKSLANQMVGNAELQAWYVKSLYAALLPTSPSPCSTLYTARHELTGPPARSPTTMPQHGPSKTHRLASSWSQHPGAIGAVARFWQRSYAPDYLGVALLETAYMLVGDPPPAAPARADSSRR